MVKAKKYIYQHHFDGLPKKTDLKLVEEELPPLKNGEFLAEAVYLSVDPYMRARAHLLSLGTTFIGRQVAKIVESKNPDYVVGQYVVGEFGWRTVTVADGKPTETGFPSSWHIPDPEGLPLSYFLGILGMPGNTAYFGFLDICQPKPGETVVVSGAGGAVGCIVGQMAKLKGCKVVGIAGTDEKGEWLLQQLNFDAFVNYKRKDFEKKLQEAVPEGVDCYFDNVGGTISSAVLARMNLFGRISVCGAISNYNEKGVPAPAPPVQPWMVAKQLKMEGFVVHRWRSQLLEGVLQNKQWIKEGKLKYKETVTEGFENMFEAFVDMLQGGNIGKAVVKV